MSAAVAGILLMYSRSSRFRRSSTLTMVCLSMNQFRSLSTSAFFSHCFNAATGGQDAPGICAPVPFGQNWPGVSVPARQSTHAPESISCFVRSRTMPGLLRSVRNSNTRQALMPVSLVLLFTPVKCASKS